MIPPDHEALLTLARRTQENLNGESEYEFTQLLNSMLCMVVGLREGYLNKHHTKWENLEGELKEREQNLEGELKKSKVLLSSIAKEDFVESIHNLRHAFAHGNFRLTASNGSNEIAGVTVWNVPPDKKMAKKGTYG